MKEDTRAFEVRFNDIKKHVFKTIPDDMQADLLKFRERVRSLKGGERLHYYTGDTLPRGGIIDRARGLEVYEAYMQGLCQPVQKLRLDGKYDYYAVGAR